MDSWIIAARYGTALLKLVQETGNGKTVAEQMERIAHVVEGSSRLRQVVNESQSVVPRRRAKVFEEIFAQEGTELAPEIRSLINLLIKNGRLDITRWVFRSFLSQYYESVHIKRGFLFVADAKAAEKADLTGKLKAEIKSKTGYDLLVETIEDPSLIGGFIFEVDDCMLDASVVSQVESIRKQFMEKNRITR